MHSIADTYLWSSFFLFFFILFAIDLFFVGGRRAQSIMSWRAALGLTVVWIACALLFGLYFWQHLIPIHGRAVANQKTIEYFTGYVIEKMLSFDNLFVFLMIFRSFAVPPSAQRRLLLWGILGAIILRFFMIFFGLWLISRLHWLLYIFAAFLVWSGVKMLFASTEAETVDLEKHRLLRWVKQYFRVTPAMEGDSFFVRRKGLVYMTPLFLALIMIETSDVIFALDSIPAIFSITLDPFIVFSSNLFAIQGLRALYFLLAHAVNKFAALQYGVALVLVLTGAKMLAGHWVDLPTLPMLLLVLLILLATGIAGFVMERKKKAHGRKH